MILNAGAPERFFTRKFASSPENRMSCLILQSSDVQMFSLKARQLIGMRQKSARSTEVVLIDLFIVIPPKLSLMPNDYLYSYCQKTADFSPLMNGCPERGRRLAHSGPAEGRCQECQRPEPPGFIPGEWVIDSLYPKRHS